MERRLAAILVADVVGYTRLMGADERGTLAALKAHREDFIDPTIAGYKGRTFKLVGDGALVEFASVIDAVSCAVELQRGMTERNAEVPQEQRIILRIGINLGDVLIDGNDIYGDGVNIAARLEGIAEPGGICLSGDAYRQAKGKVEVAFDDLGERNLKNVAEPIRIYRVAGSRPLNSTTVPKKAPLPLPDKPSVAVLPFLNLSGDPKQEYFADGLTEDSITELSRFRNLFVIASNSSFTYKGRTTDGRRAAEELGVRYIVEGTVRRAGGRIRVSVQLIDALTREHVWGERYDRDLEDIFAVQDEITRTIVAAIEPELANAERSRAHRSPPENLDAWGLYQRGSWHVYRFTAEDIAEAESLFERATAADPNFAPAFAGLSLAYFLNAFLGLGKDRDRYRDLALEAAEHAIALDDRDEFARRMLGRAYLIRAEHDRAIAEFKAAIELNPNYAQAHYNLGWALVLAGRPEEALPHIDTAERLSPRDPLLFGFCATRAQALFLIGDIDHALEEARRSSRQPNAHANSRAVLVAILGCLGLSEEASAELAQIRAKWPDYSRRNFAMGYPYRTAEDMGRFLEGLTAAGMPE